MLKIISIMIVGVLLGYLFRRFPRLSVVKKLPIACIFLLLFSLGMSVGANDEIMNNLSSIGLQAGIITLGSLIGCLILSKIVYEKFFRREEVKDEE